MIEIIEGLTQLEGSIVLKISTEVVPVSTTSVARESSQPRELQEDLPSPSPQPGKISEFDILTLNIVTDIIIMTTGNVAPAQEEELIIDTSAKDIPIEAATRRPSLWSLFLRLLHRKLLQFPILKLLW